MTRSILLKGTLALALLPAAAGGVALASSAPERTTTPAAQVLPASSTVSHDPRGRANEPGEDGPRKMPLVASTTSRASELGDDSGGHGSRTNRMPETGDDHGDDTTRTPETGDDHGGHGGSTSGSGRHGADDGAGHH